MATPLTSRERYSCAFRHQEPDRVPLADSFWPATIDRWHGEGLPADVAPAQFFGFDRLASIACDNSPGFPEKVVEETDEYRIVSTRWGTTQRTWKHRASVPEFLGFQVVDRDSWAVAKARMVPSENRVDWVQLDRHYRQWREDGAWIYGGGWFGFDVLHSWFVGTERVLIAIAEDPEWVREMIETMLDLNLALLDLAWDRGYTFDCLRWPDDLAFVKGPFFSPQTYREVVQPAHRRAVEWAHAKGAFAMLHSDGNLWPLLDDILDTGVDAMQPFEQKAGMDLRRVKQQYGDRLVMEGGIDVRQMPDPTRIEDHVRTTLQAAMPGGGYCYHSDHSIPSDVSFSDYCRVLALVRHYGTY